MAKMDLSIEMEMIASGLTVRGQDFMVLDPQQDAVQQLVCEVNRLARVYKQEYLKARTEYGSCRNIKRAAAGAHWWGADLDFEYSKYKICCLLAELDGYAEEDHFLRVERVDGSTRPYSVWRKAFEWWCFNTPLED